MQLLETPFMVFFGAHLLFIGAWNIYLSELRKRTLRKIHRICNNNKVAIFDQKKEPKLYTIYTHEGESHVELEKGQEITLTGFQLKETIQNYYLSKAALNPSYQFKPIAIMKIQQLHTEES